MTTPINMAIEILHKTEDGERLSPSDLNLVQSAVNGWLSEKGEVAFYQLYANVNNGYQTPWFHNIEHLTRGHDGYVKWRGVVVEHYDDSYAHTDRAKQSALEVSRRCKVIENRGQEPNTNNVIWRWNESEV